MAHKRVNITLEEDVLAQLDAECELLHMKRSTFISNAVLSKIAERQQIEVINANPQVYRDMILQIAKGIK